MSFAVIITPSAEKDLQHYRKNEQRIILEGILLYLSQHPNTATDRNKALRPNSLAPRELKLGDHRVFYTIDGQTVSVLAIGHKSHNWLYIRGKEVFL